MTRPTSSADIAAYARHSRWSDPGGFAAQLVSAFGTANAFHHPGILQFEKNEFQEFFREHFFVGNVANLDRALVMVTGQHHHRLESVESFLRDLHSCSINSI